MYRNAQKVKFEVTELGRSVTSLARELQKTLVFITIPGPRIDRPRKILRDKMNEVQEAQFVELAARLHDFTYYIIWETSGSIFNEEEKKELADYFLTEKLINCLAYYQPPNEFTTYYGQSVRHKMQRFVEKKLIDGTLNAISLDEDCDSDIPVVNLDRFLLDGYIDREVEEQIVDDEVVQAILTRVNSLPEEDRQLLVLRFYHELTFTDIAIELGVAEATIRHRLKRILTQLRESCAN